MTTNILNVTTQEVVPKTFIRGQTLEFVMLLPPEVPANFFGPIPINPLVPDGPAYPETVVTSQLRRLENAGEDGLIAQLQVSWEPGTSYTKLRFKYETTNTWPLGPAEFDVTFVRTIGVATTKKYRSQPIAITIKDGITA